MPNDPSDHEVLLASIGGVIEQYELVRQLLTDLEAEQSDEERVLTQTGISHSIFVILKYGLPEVICKYASIKYPPEDRDFPQIGRDAGL